MISETISVSQLISYHCSPFCIRKFPFLFMLKSLFYYYKESPFRTALNDETDRIHQCKPIAPLKSWPKIAALQPIRRYSLFFRRYSLKVRIQRRIQNGQRYSLSNKSPIMNSRNFSVKIQSIRMQSIYEKFSCRDKV